MRKFLTLLFVALSAFYMSSCSEAKMDTPDALAQNILEALQNKDENKFTSCFASYEDYVERQKTLDLPKQTLDRLKKELEKRKEKYAQIPLSSYKNLLSEMTTEKINPSALNIDHLDVKKSSALGRESMSITVHFKKSPVQLYLPSCSDFDGQLLIEEPIQLVL